jgi:rhamnopyranosyl-N-acetylglucosaminyl-diphospho-decaprenol beta-1,3/1,4-galactofuranosyltransferase
VVVTYNRKALLRECLAALQAQLRDEDEILVVDNASSDGTSELLDKEFPDVQRLTLPENVGGSGGFYEGMKWAYERGFDWLWLMDDDGRPAPDCLARLLAHRRPNTVIVPLQHDSGGRLYGIAKWQKRSIDVTAEIVAQKQPVIGSYLFAFVGPLVPRTAIEQVGLPNKDFFIWFDDAEYSLRLSSKGVQVEVVPDALFFHNMGENARVVRFLGRRSIRSEFPPWKLYYGIRNPLYTLLRTRRDPQELLLFLLMHIRLLLMDIVYGPARWERVRQRLLGFRDGVIGRLGKQA